MRCLPGIRGQGKRERRWCLTPAEVFEFGELRIRRAEENELPAATAAEWFATPS